MRRNVSSTPAIVAALLLGCAGGGDSGGAAPAQEIAPIGAERADRVDRSPLAAGLPARAPGKRPEVDESAGENATSWDDESTAEEPGTAAEEGITDPASGAAVGQVAERGMDRSQVYEVLGVPLEERADPVRPGVVWLVYEMPGAPGSRLEVELTEERVTSTRIVADASAAQDPELQGISEPAPEPAPVDSGDPEEERPPWETRRAH